MTRSQDSALVDAAQKGSREAVADLFERHWLDAWRLAYGITGSTAHADDAAQQGFVHAIERIGRLRDSGRFRPWLHRIVVNEALGDRRRQRREVLVGQIPDAEARAADDGSTPSPALDALARLSPERRAAIVLRHCLDYSLEETAEILGVPVGTVQSRVGRGLTTMRAELEVRDVE